MLALLLNFNHRRLQNSSDKTFKNVNKKIHGSLLCATPQWDFLHYRHANLHASPGCLIFHSILPVCASKRIFAIRFATCHKCFCFSVFKRASTLLSSDSLPCGKGLGSPSTFLFHTKATKSLPSETQTKSESYFHDTVQKLPKPAEYSSIPEVSGEFLHTQVHGKSVPPQPAP